VGKRLEGYRGEGKKKSRAPRQVELFEGEVLLEGIVIGFGDLGYWGWKGG